MNTLRDLNDTIQEWFDNNTLRAFRECDKSEDNFVTVLLDDCMDGFNYPWSAKEVLEVIKQLLFIQEQEGNSSIVDQMRDGLFNEDALLKTYAACFFQHEGLSTFYYNKAKEDYVNETMTLAHLEALNE